MIVMCKCYVDLNNQPLESVFFSSLKDGIAYANNKPSNVAIYEIKVGKAYDMSNFGIPIYIKPKDFTFETNNG